MDMDTGMTISERATITLRWSSASLAISVLTFLITVFYIYKYRSTKAAFIAGSASISILALLILHAITVAAILGEPVLVSVTSALVGIQYSFAFYTVFYAFNCLIRNASKSKKLVVYFGYIWMVVTIASAIAASVILTGDTFSYSETAFKNLSNLMSFVSYSIWGFIAIALLLFFMNTKLLNRKAKFTMLAFIGLNIISAITATTIVYSTTINMHLLNGIYFFFSELPTDASIIIVAYYGHIWIQDHSNEHYIGSQSEV